MNTQLAALRRLLKKHGIQAYLVPSADPHQSEYPPECWKRRQFVTGFTGSAGDAVITLKKAGLWTDSRYYLQAERELEDSGFALFKWGLPGVPSWQAWIAQELKSGETFGFDPQLITHGDYVKLESKLERRGIRVKAIEKNLVDEVWPERPAAPRGPIAIHKKIHAGEGVGSKIKRLRRKMAEEGADAHVLSQLDAVAWLFNIRGSDVEFNPVAIAYAIITKGKARLFVAREKVASSVRKILSRDVEVCPYEDFGAHLRRMGERRQRVWLDEVSVSQWIVRRLGRGALLVLKPSPVALFKAVKNKTEIEGSKAAHLRDGAAMVKFLYWLDKEVSQGGVTELSAARKIEEFRSREKRYKGLSFTTISSYAGHGAVVHYAVSPETDIRLRPEGLYLIDSGSQYLEATTDITRTVCLGRTTEEQRDRFTRVLKGMIALTRIAFPQGTSGPQLDILARKALWERGLNYGHGTGHGIGAFLNVHEGPQSIAPARGFGISLEPGMILSNEPAFYKEGEYGLRVENLVLIVKDKARSSPALTFYTFETLTLCPINTRLVKRDLLTDDEVQWLNSYHRTVRRLLSPLFKNGEAAWLNNATRPI
jgi:Xaa-Pro aminopeptidase